MDKRTHKTVRIHVEDFVQFLTISSPVAANTIRLVVGRTHIIFAYLDTEDLPLTYSSIERFLFSLKTKGLKNNSINTYIFVIKNLYKYCKQREIEIDDKLGELEMLPKEKPIIDPLTIEEEKRLLAVDIEYIGLFHGKSPQRLNVVYKALIRFLMTTGCRYEEAASLQLKHVDLSARRVRFEKTKNKEYRYAYIREPLLTQMKEQMEGCQREDYVFRNMVGKKIYTTDFSPDLRERAKLAGITKRVHPHIFRHSYATELLSNDVGIEKVANLIGHKDIQTTFKNYAHLADRTLQKANDVHPLNRENISPFEKLEQAIAAFNAHHLQQDSAFDRAAIEQGLALLWKSVKE